MIHPIRKAMIRSTVVSALLAASAGPAAHGQMLTSLFSSQVSSDQPTVITSDTMDIDMKGNSALLTGHVVVEEPATHITADKMTVYFGTSGGSKTEQEKQIRRILCEGDVNIKKIVPKSQEIENGEQKAVADKADYDVEKGVIVLSGNPVLSQGKNNIKGDMITLWRDSDRMRVESKSKNSAAITIHEGRTLTGGGAAGSAPAPKTDNPKDSVSKTPEPEPAVQAPTFPNPEIRKKAADTVASALWSQKQGASTRSDDALKQAIGSTKLAVKYLSDYLEKSPGVKDPGAASAMENLTKAGKWQEFKDWKNAEKCISDALSSLQGQSSATP